MKVKDRERPSKRQKAKLIKKQAWNLEGKPYACSVTAGTHTQKTSKKTPVSRKMCSMVWNGAEVGYEDDKEVHI